MNEPGCIFNKVKALIEGCNRFSVETVRSPKRLKKEKGMIGWLTA